jgi:hypothetical protein
VDLAKIIVSSTAKRAQTTNEQVFNQEYKKKHLHLLNIKMLILINKEIISLFKDHQLMKKIM